MIAPHQVILLNPYNRLKHKKSTKNLRLILLKENNHFARPRKIFYSLLCFTNTIKSGLNSVGQNPCFLCEDHLKKKVSDITAFFFRSWVDRRVCLQIEVRLSKICWSPVEKCINRLIAEIDKKKYSIYGNKSKTTSEVVL